MKIAISAKEPSLDGDVEERFGRSPYFLVVDTDTMETKTVENPNVAASGGAGIQSAKLISDMGAKAVITGNCGPNAFDVFNASGIDVITGASGKIRDVIERFKKGEFTRSSSSNVESHSGMGQSTQPQQPGFTPGMGMGRGMGQGGGRGMGRGGGRGMGRCMQGNFASVQPNQPIETPMQPSDELEMLKNEIEALEEYRKEILKRIEELESKK